MTAFNCKYYLHATRLRLSYLMILFTFCWGLPGLGQCEQINRLTNVNYSPTSSKSAVVELTFAEPVTNIEIERRSNSLMVTGERIIVGKEQLYILDTTEHQQPVYEIETFSNHPTILLKISIRDNANYSVVKSIRDNRVELAFQFNAEPLMPLSKYSKSLSQKNEVTLNFQDIPIRQVLTVIADLRGFNLVVADSVSGNISINLEQVEWENALDLILSMRGLGKRIKNNILLVAPFAELIQQEKEYLSWQEQLRQSEDAVTTTIKINYADAHEVKNIIRKLLYNNSLDDKENVTVDVRNNSIIVTDSPSRLLKIRKIVAEVDVAAPQILIESRIVTVREGIDNSLGIRWGITDSGVDGAFSGTVVGAESAFSGSKPSIGDRLAIDLPISSAAGRFGFHMAKLSDNQLLDLELSALQQNNSGEVIATPKLMVSNKHEAYIEQGSEIPFVQASSSGATAVTFKKAVLSLKVTPHITPNNHLILELVITQDTKGDVVTTSTGPAMSIDTQEIKTQVHLEHGETVVLGGIFQNNVSLSEKKVPFLGDIPILGHLFKSQQKVEGRRELLIFVTPTIINP